MKKTILNRNAVKSEELVKASGGVTALEYGLIGALVGLALIDVVAVPGVKATKA